MHCQSYLVFIAIPFLLPTAAQAPEDGPPEECRPGSYMSKVSGRCVYCVAGTDFTDTYNRRDACLKCATCTGGKLKKSECTTTRNTICMCPADHYEHDDGCSPIQAVTPRPANDVIAELREHIGDAINNFSLSVELLFNRSSAQLVVHSDETRNLSLTADVRSHWILDQILGIKKDFIAGSQSHTCYLVAIIVLVLVAIVLQVIFFAVTLRVLLKNRQHIPGQSQDSENGQQPKQQLCMRLGAGLCDCIRPTSRTPAADAKATSRSGDAPPDSRMLELSDRPQASKDQSTPDSKTGAGRGRQSADKARDADAKAEREDRYVSSSKSGERVELPAAGASGKLETDNQGSRMAAAIVDGGAEDTPLLNDCNRNGQESQALPSSL